MLIFNESVNIFIKKQKERLVEIRKQYGLTAYNVSNIFISDTDKFLGEYHYNRKAIILSKSLMLMKQETIDHVLKHEFAHHCSLSKYGPAIDAHGKEFSDACRLMDIKPDAKVNINKMDSENNASLKEEAILEKVKKLFALAESQNENESKLALQKANDLLNKHNLKYVTESFGDIYQEVVYEGKQANQKWHMIAHLLRELFDVYPVFSYKTRIGVELEVNGTKESVEIASYVASFLDKEMEFLFKKAKKENNLKGRSARSNYFNALINNYISSVKKTNGIQEENKNNVNEVESDSKELINQEKYLAKKKEDFFKNIKKTVYGKGLKKSYSRISRNQAASNAGKKDSSKLSIRSGVGSSSQKLLS
jgi:predicted metal-dependent hydrolase